MDDDEFSSMQHRIKDEKSPAGLHRRIQEAHYREEEMTAAQQAAMEDTMNEAMDALDAADEDELLEFMEDDVESIKDEIEAEQDPISLHQHIQAARDKKMTPPQRHEVEAAIATALADFGVEHLDDLLRLPKADGDVQAG